MSLTGMNATIDAEVTEDEDFRLLLTFEQAEALADAIEGAAGGEGVRAAFLADLVTSIRDALAAA